MENKRELSTRKYAREVWFLSALCLAIILTLETPMLAMAGGKLAIETISNRSDKISGGDALVHVDVPPGVAPDEVTVKLNGIDVTNLFAIDGIGSEACRLCPPFHRWRI